MNRLIAVHVVVAIAAFSLTACSGSPSPASTSATAASAPAAATSSAAEPTTASSKESTTSGQTLAEACLEPNAKMAEATAELAKASAAVSASDGKNAQAVADAIIKMGDYFAAMAESTTNTDVKASLNGIAKAYRKMGELYPKAMKQDMAALTGLMTVMTDLQKSLTDFQTLCTA